VNQLRRPDASLPAFFPKSTVPTEAGVHEILQLLESSGAALVVANGVGHLPSRVLQAAATTRLQLLVVLCPGVARVGEVLDRIGEFVGPAPVRQDVRVLASPWGARNPDLAVLARANGEHHSAGLQLAIGSGDLSLGAPAECQMATEADAEAAYEFQAWFQNLWASAVPFTTHVSTDYPAWSQPSSRAADEWEAFRRSLLQQSEAGVPAAESGPTAPPPTAAAAAGKDTSVTLFELVDPDAAEGTMGGAAATRMEEAGSVVAVPAPHPLAREIKDLYARGRLVTVHMTDKVPTYRLDVTELLGQVPQSRVGRVSATGSIRLDLLPSQARTTVEAIRREASLILSRHSFRLGENQHWVPLGAEPHFASRLELMTSIPDLPSLLGKEVADYVEDEMDALIGSLVKVTHDRRIDLVIDQEVVSRLSAAVSAHLLKNAKINVRAGYSAERLTYMDEPGASVHRPYQLLIAAASATRQRLANPGSPAKREAEGPPLPCLDVVGGDGLLHLEPSFEVATIARAQQRRISELSEAGASQEACSELICLMREAP
jgi:hypothetical protein